MEQVNEPSININITQKGGIVSWRQSLVLVFLMCYLLTAEHLLYAGHPEGAYYALVWSPEGHPRHPEPGPQHQAPFPIPLLHHSPFARTSETSDLGQKMPTEGRGFT